MNDNLAPTPRSCLGLALLVIAFMLVAAIACPFVWVGVGVISSDGLVDMASAVHMLLMAAALIIEYVLPIALPILVVLGIIWWLWRWTPPPSHRP